MLEFRSKKLSDDLAWFQNDHNRKSIHIMHSAIARNQVVHLLRGIRAIRIHRVDRTASFAIAVDVVEIGASSRAPRVQRGRRPPMPSTVNLLFSPISRFSGGEEEWKLFLQLNLEIYRRVERTLVYSAHFRRPGAALWIVFRPVTKTKHTMQSRPDPHACRGAQCTSACLFKGAMDFLRIHRPLASWLFPSSDSAPPPLLDASVFERSYSLRVSY